MNQQLIVVLVCGLAAGALVVWLALRPRIKQEYNRAKGESEAERAALLERLQGRQDQIQKLEAELTEFQQENASLLTRSSSLEAQLSAERKSSTEKLEVLEQAQRERAAIDRSVR